MVDYLGILRMSSAPENTKRGMERALHCSRHTIQDVLDAAKDAGVTWPLDEDVTNEELRGILFPKRFAVESKYANPDYAYIHRELSKPGVNLTLLWTEYCKQCEETKATPYMMYVYSGA